MSFWVVWDKETGRIDQGNKIYFPDEQYEAAAKELGQLCFKASDTEVFNPDFWFAPEGLMTSRPPMNILLNSNRIQCGDKGAAVFEGLPKPVKWHLVCMGMIVHTDQSTKGKLEVQVPVPGLYEVRFDQWPYQESRFTFEAV